jgi:hypothetical protein
VTVPERVRCPVCAGRTCRVVSDAATPSASAIQIRRIIHLVAFTQISRHPEGRAYYQQKKREGKTTQEARCGA